MSRLTSAQLIQAGFYLEPDFDPTTLTIPQLLGILGFHNIPYPTPHNKSKLIAVFNEEIKPRTKKYKKERLKREESLASDEGITDGRTGKLLNEHPPKPLARRSSRRLSQAPPSPPPAPAPQPKRRRSSAQPGPSRKPTVPKQPVVVEESEEDEEEQPPRKVVRTKKTASRRRISGPDSGWEDNNIFQSGAESSSPARPSPKLTRRSTGPRKRASATPAPVAKMPLFADDDDEPMAMDEPPVPVRKPFDFSLPREPSSPIREPSPVRQSPIRQSPVRQSPVRQSSPLREPSPSPSPARLPKFSPPPAPRPSSPFTPGLASRPRFAEDRRDSEAVVSDMVDPGPSTPFAPRIPSHLSKNRRDSELVVQEMVAPAPSTPVRRMPIFRPRDSEAVVREMVAPQLKSPLAEAPQSEDGSQILDDEDEDEDSADAHNKAISNRIAQGGKALVRSNNSLPVWTSLFFLVLSAYATLSAPKRLAAASVGFCDTGNNINDAVVEVDYNRAALTAACTDLNLTQFDDFQGNAVACNTTIYDVACTPCPPHAVCSNGHLERCEQGYKLVPYNSLLGAFTSPSTEISWPSVTQPGPLVVKTIRWALDGSPGFGSVALPPSCVLDRRRKHIISRSVSILEDVLREVHGQKMCSGFQGSVPEEEGGEAKRWGLSVEELKGLIKHKLKADNVPQFSEDFEETLRKALESKDVFMRTADEYGYIVCDIDLSSSGSRYVASESAHTGLVCKAKLEAKRYTPHIIGLVLFVVSAAVQRLRSLGAENDQRRAESLVGHAMKILRDQEVAHYTDPVTTPHTYVPSLHLRDRLMVHDHNLNTRKSVWKRVEAIVETNANVRVNLEDVDGDEMRVWRWIGGGGRRVESEE